MTRPSVTPEQRLAVVRRALTVAVLQLDWLADFAVEEHNDFAALDHIEDIVEQITNALDRLVGIEGILDLAAPEVTA